MPIKTISQDKFHSYPNENNPMASLYAKEKLWFSDDDNNIIATVLLDNFDNDWGFVIMALDSDGKYRAIHGEASLESIDLATEKLKTKITDLVQEGEVKESLFDFDTNEEEIEKSGVIITDINLEIKKYFKKHPEKLHELDPRKFEELIASIMEDFGFDVELTKATRDGGRDIIANIKNAVTDFLAYVECKRYSPTNKVGVSIIREVAGVHNLRRPSKSIIVTTSTFTKDAIKEASIMNDQIKLNDYFDLKNWLSRY